MSKYRGRSKEVDVDWAKYRKGRTDAYSFIKLSVFFDPLVSTRVVILENQKIENQNRKLQSFLKIAKI